MATVKEVAEAPTTYRPRYVVEGFQFGSERSDWGGKSPLEWLEDNRKEILLPFEEIESAKVPFEIDDVPHSEGIYFLFNNDCLEYVGLATVLHRRLFQHAYDRPSLRRAKWLTHYSAIWAPERLLEVVENFYLYLLYPRRNEQFRPMHDITRKYLRSTGQQA